MKLRIGLITSEFPPDFGGVETYAWQLAKELGARPDLQVTVYVPPKSAGVTAPQNVTIERPRAQTRNATPTLLRSE